MTLQVSAQFSREDFRFDVDASWPLQGVTALFGRSGCGKTSLLRIIAGLDRVHGASVRFADECWQAGKLFVPIEKRRVGLVFQETSLLPHMSVYGNLLYGYQRTKASLRRLQPDEIIGMLELQDLLSRPTDRLSGGQRQRVALGRALLCSPQLLLLDEPLAALDTQSRREIMPFLSRLAADSDVPVVLITHAPDEVLRLADRVVFMRSGCIDDICTLAQAMAHANSPLFADDGPSSVLEGTIEAVDEQGLSVFATPQVQLIIQSGAVRGGKTRVKVMARDVSVALEDPVRISIRNHLRVTINAVERLSGQRVLLNTSLADGQILLIEITEWSAEQLALVAGMDVWALIKSVALVR